PDAYRSPLAGMLVVFARHRSLNLYPSRSAEYSDEAAVLRKAPRWSIKSRTHDSDHGSASTRYAFRPVERPLAQRGTRGAVAGAGRLCAWIRAPLRRRFRRAARHPRRGPRHPAQPEFSMSLTALRRLLLPALLAGLAAGVVASLLQQVFLVPLIVRAETLEPSAQRGLAARPTLQPTA